MRFRKASLGNWSPCLTQSVWSVPFVGSDFTSASEMRGLFLLLLFCPTYLSSRIISLGVPESVFYGDPIWLNCNYDLEGDALLSISWYKDAREIYRYHPNELKELPFRKFCCNIPGVFLEPKFSNNTHVYLSTSTLDTAGYYRCAVFSKGDKTVQKEKMLKVHVTPIEPPRIKHNGGYKRGDLVNMSCVFGPSEILYRIIWYINGPQWQQASSSHELPGDLRQETSSLHLPTESLLSFVRDWMVHSVTCVAEVLQNPVVATIELLYELGKNRKYIHHFPAMGFPSITHTPRWFSLGDNIDLNCFAGKPNHLVKLEWRINDEPVPPEMLSGDKGSNLRLRFQVTEKHWRRVNLKCRATMSRLTTTCAHSQLGARSTRDRRWALPGIPRTIEGRCPNI